jgi:ribosome-associated heat shock protein Hsp15
MRGLKRILASVESLKMTAGRQRAPRARQAAIAFSRGGTNLRAMQVPEQVRLDKWLCAVRLYRSRSLAAEACTAGHVKIDGQSVKPARAVRVGETIAVQTGGLTRTVRVLGLLSARVGAQAAREFAEDLTPPEEYARAREERARTPQFPKGFGRPTKKQRRLMEGWVAGPDEVSER